MNLSKPSRVLLAATIAAGVVGVSLWSGAARGAERPSLDATVFLPFEDNDNDLLPGALEHVLMMDPTNADTDFDGTGDFIEAVQHQVNGNPPPSPPLPLDHEMRAQVSLERLPGLGEQVVLNVLLRVADANLGQVTSLVPFIEFQGQKVSIQQVFLQGVVHLAGVVDPNEGLLLLISSRLASPATLRGLMPFAIGVQGTIGQRSFETGSVLVYMDNTVMAITPVPTNRFVMHPIDPQFLQDPGSPGIGFWQTSQACELELVVTGTGGGFSLCQVVQAGCTGAPTLSCPPSCSSLVNSILLIPDSLRFLTGN